MKRLLSLILAGCLSFCCLSFSAAEVIEPTPNLALEAMKERDTFSRDGGDSWSYYQTVWNRPADGSYVQFIWMAWGDGTELSDYPVLCVIAKDPEGNGIQIRSATLLAAGNMYELAFEEMSLADGSCAAFHITSDALSLLESLWQAKTFSVLLRHEGGVLTLELNEEENAPLKRFAMDIIGLDFPRSVRASDNEEDYRQKTPIFSYISPTAEPAPEPTPTPEPTPEPTPVPTHEPAFM